MLGKALQETEVQHIQELVIDRLALLRVYFLAGIPRQALQEQRRSNWANAKFTKKTQRVTLTLNDMKRRLDRAEFVEFMNTLRAQQIAHSQKMQLDHEIGSLRGIIPTATAETRAHLQQKLAELEGAIVA